MAKQLRFSVPDEIIRNKNRCAETEVQIARLYAWLPNARDMSTTELAQEVRDSIVQLTRVLQCEKAVVLALENLKLEYDTPTNKGANVAAVLFL